LRLQGTATRRRLSNQDAGIDAFGRRGRDVTSEEREERAEDDRRRKDELRRRRETETAEWHDYGLRLKRENSRIMARALRTKTEPVVYWRPFKMLAVQEELVERQVRAAEEEVASEKEDVYSGRVDHVGVEQAASGGSAVLQHKDTEKTIQNGTHGDDAPPVDDAATASGTFSAQHQNSKQIDETSREAIDDNDVEEMLVDAGEDAVIY
jgi:hypothetical protein